MPFCVNDVLNDVRDVSGFGRFGLMTGYVCGLSQTRNVHVCVYMCVELYACTHMVCIGIALRIPHSKSILNPPANP